MHILCKEKKNNNKESMSGFSKNILMVKLLWLINYYYQLADNCIYLSYV